MVFRVLRVVQIRVIFMLAYVAELCFVLALSRLEQAIHIIWASLKIFPLTGILSAFEYNPPLFLSILQILLILLNELPYFLPFLFPFLLIIFLLLLLP